MTSISKLTSDKLFFEKNQKYLNIFIFFNVFPFIKIGGISITFYIFLYIVFLFKMRGLKLFYANQLTDKLLLLFLCFVTIAAITAEESFVNRSVFSIIKLMSQYVYWVILALFIKTWLVNYDFYKISRVIFFAAVISVIYYPTLNHLHRVFLPNALPYVIVIAMPVSYYYVLKRYSIKVVLLITAGFILGVLFTGSRTGTTLVILESVFLLSLGSVKLKKLSIISAIIILPILITISSSFDQSDLRRAKLSTADILEDYSPKIAHTLRMKENVFDRDKSWLIRELMLQKGVKIFKEHPYFGVGPGNFFNYYVELDIGGVSRWLHKSERKYNRKSSQNSYLMILAEDGIFALISILLVFGTIMWRGFYYVKSFKDNAEIFIYIPFIALLFYSVILVTTLGSLFWLLLGMALTLIKHDAKLS